MLSGIGNRAARSTALGVLAAVALSLALSACGGGSPDATAGAPKTAATAGAAATQPGSTGGSQPGDQPKPAAASGACAGQLGGFLAAMDALRTNLVTGLSYQDYVEELQSIRGTYHRVPVEKLALGCLEAAGNRGERALNAYIAASNTWSDCVEVAGCAAASVEPALQSRWRAASKLLSSAQQGLSDLEKPPKAG